MSLPTPKSVSSVKCLDCDKASLLVAKLLDLYDTDQKKQVNEKNLHEHPTIMISQKLEIWN